MQRIGLFVAGFHWSGSGAVADWLEGHDAIISTPASEAAFGEIRAVNYGMRNLLLAAERPRLYGERLGRLAICPDSAIWPNLLGTLLQLQRPFPAPLLGITDLLYTAVARHHLTPRISQYLPMLNSQLGQDFREDADYLSIVNNLAEVLREGVCRCPSRWDVVRSSEVSEAVSELVALFADRLQSNGTIHLFNNTISARYARQYHLINTKWFPRQVILFVSRDPRDQFAELVRFSGSTFSFSVRRFIAGYHRYHREVQDIVNEYAADPRRIVRLISFESFVHDSDDSRKRLHDELQRVWNEVGLKGSWQSGTFDPKASIGNIGIWKKSKMKRQMRMITTQLSEHLSQHTE